MSATSVSLLQRLRSPDAGDSSEAWRSLVELYGPLIRHWLRQHAALAPDADDLVQEVLAVLVRRIGDFQHNGRLGAFRVWLRTVTRHCVSDFYATRRNRPLATGSSSVQEALGELARVDSPLSQLWDREHDLWVVRRLVEMLRGEFEPRTWLAFEGVALQGRPAAEVAAELGLTTNAVVIAKSRVLRRLNEEAEGLID